MITYAATFISGFGETVQEALKKDIFDAAIQFAFDGLLLFSTDSTPDTVMRCRYFTNIFLVLNAMPFTQKDTIPSIVKALYRNSDYTIAKSLTRGRRQTFRIFVSKENQLISIHNEIQHKIEDTVSQLAGMQLNPLKADYEFWFMLRREGQAFFGIRLTTHKPLYAKGELHRELANILCLLSHPSKEDIVLDPFCGSGAIPLERAQAFPYSKIIAGDTNQNLVAEVKRRSRTIDRFETKHLDALHLTFLQNASIDKVITDPPWGLHEDIRDIRRFYGSMLHELLRVVKPGGTMIILTARESPFPDVLQESKEQISGMATQDILVSGKKATVYRITVR